MVASPVHQRPRARDPTGSVRSMDESLSGDDEVHSPPLTQREQLRSRVYDIRHELSTISMASPPRQVMAPSDFLSYSGLVKDESKGFKSFPESGHTKSALNLVNENIGGFHSSKGSGSKFVGFGPTTLAKSQGFRYPRLVDR